MNYNICICNIYNICNLELDSKKILLFFIIIKNIINDV